MNIRVIDARYLRGNPMPEIAEGGDKHSRGRVLVIAGSVHVPGAALLAGLGALRAGAGVLQIATCRSHSAHLGVAIPEAMVIGCDETSSGEVSPSNVSRLVEFADDADVVLMGPGMMDEAGAAELRARLMSKAGRPVYILDASSFTSLRSGRETAMTYGRKTVVTPHAGEMAKFLGRSKREVDEDPLSAAQACAGQLEAVVVLKGSSTYVVSPTEDALSFGSGPIALGTSGSGDVLAGVMAGIAARGADLVRAAAWAVYLHGEAGRVWTKRRGSLGLLAREIPHEIPDLMRAFEMPDKSDDTGLL